MKSKILILLNLALTFTAHAGSATWNLSPTSGDWNTAVNWRPRTVPNGPNDTATFAVSDTTNVLVTAAHTEVDGIVFTPGASPFTITTPYPASLSFMGAGIVNDSETLQNFVSGVSFSDVFKFYNEATAGNQTMFTLSDTSVISFYNEATAGSGTFIVQGTPYFEDGAPQVSFFGNSTAANGTFINMGGSGQDGQGGGTSFLDNSTAANGTFTNTAATAPGTYYGSATLFTDNATAADATITNEGGAAINEHAGYTVFYGNATAGNAIITCDGGQAAGAEPGELYFYGISNASNATLIAKGGSNGGDGGLISVFETADGGPARVELFGNGTLDISSSTSIGGVSIGSLEGDGLVFLGAQNLSIGSNALSTAFLGTIQDGGISGGTGGSLTKLGTGTLKLTGANNYTGGTFVEEGSLLVNNRNGSATGPGAVQLNAGTLGGSGTIAGPVTVGTGNGTGAFLAPSLGVRKPTILTFQSALTFKVDATYTYKVNTKRARADTTVANGVTIESGAQFNFVAVANDTLTAGKVFVAISNTSANPIRGTLSNLPDGGIVTINGNNFQASYSGGDGNDLTLTVVP